MKVKWYGHAAFSIESEGKKLLLDPFISENPLVKGQVKLDDIKCNYILLSHAHFDHIGDAEFIAKKNKATIISCAEIVGYYQTRGINGHPMNCGGSWKFDFGIVKMVKADHSSSFPDGTYGGVASSILLFIENKWLFFAGDTAANKNMEIWGKLHNIYLSFLPVGSNFTMDVDEAVLAAEMLKTKKVIPMHYNTWDLIKADENVIRQKFSQKGFEVIMLKPLQEVEI